jgi:hypothetical protein
MTWAAWVKPKADEANMINSMLQVKFHIVLCFRAKEKIKIIKGQDPQDLGWRPIASDRIHFETAFTLILPPNSKGTPDLSMTGSELRSPFDTMIKATQLNETLGKQLAEWSAGGTSPQEPAKQSADPTPAQPEKTPLAATSASGGGLKPKAGKTRGEAIMCPNFAEALKPIKNCETCAAGKEECPSWG